MRRALILATLLLLPVALAANDPGHDTLYLEQLGKQNLTGALNISEWLRVAELVYSDYLDIQGNGTQPGNSRAEIYATSGNGLHFNAPGNFYFGSTGGGSMVYLGTSGVSLNVSGDAYVAGSIYQSGTAVCLANGTNCVGGNNTGNVSSVTAGDGLTDSGSASNPVLNINAGTGLELSGDAIGINSTVCTASNGLCSTAGDGTGGWTNSSSQTNTSLNASIQGDDRWLFLTDGSGQGVKVGGATETQYHSQVYLQGLDGAKHTILNVVPGGDSNTATAVSIWNDEDEDNHGAFGLKTRSEYAIISTDNTGTPSQALSKLGIELDAFDGYTGEEFTVGYNDQFSLGSPSILFKATQGSPNIFYISGDAGINDESPDATLDVQNSANTDIGLIVKGAASQSANLQEWQNSSDDVLANIDASGNLNISNTGSCVYLPGGGRVCGNTTCTTIYSPDGASKVEACN